MRGNGNGNGNGHRSYHNRRARGDNKYHPDSRPVEDTDMTLQDLTRKVREAEERLAKAPEPKVAAADGARALSSRSPSPVDATQKRVTQSSSPKSPNSFLWVQAPVNDQTPKNDQALEEKPKTPWSCSVS